MAAVGYRQSSRVKKKPAYLQEYECEGLLGDLLDLDDLGDDDVKKSDTVKSNVVKSDVKAGDVVKFVDGKKTGAVPRNPDEPKLGVTKPGDVCGAGGNEDDVLATDHDSGVDPATKFLLGERQMLVDSLFENSEKARRLVYECGSRSRAGRLVERMKKGLRDLKDVLKQLGELGDGARDRSLKEMKAFQNEVDEVEDIVDDYLESRRDDAPSEYSCSSTSTARFAVPSQTHGKMGPGVSDGKAACTEKTVFPGVSDAKAVVQGTDALLIKPEFKDNVSESGESCKSEKEAKIKEVVAELRVKQEKARFEQEQRIREAQKEVELQKMKDEVERVQLEASLWKQNSDVPVAQKLTRNSTLMSPLEGSGIQHACSLGNRESSPWSPKVREQAEGLRQFFQGVAKPKLRTFNGSGDSYYDWREQFDLFVHQANIPAKHKMVMLKSSLTGRPHQLIEKLGYSETHYEAALSKLEERYGGKRRLIQRHMKRLIGSGNNKVPAEEDLTELEKISDIISDVVISLKEYGGESELIGDSALFTLAMKRVPDQLVLRYQDSDPSPEGLGTFSTWLSRFVNRRLELREIRSNDEKSDGDRRGKKKETGKDKKSGKPVKSAKSVELYPTSLVTISEKEEKCPSCQGKHSLFNCSNWRSATTRQRWEIAKSTGACYRCLSSEHKAPQCPATKKCGIGGCERTHHRDLHNPSSGNGVSSQKRQTTQTTSKPKTEVPKSEKPKDASSNSMHTSRFPSQVLPLRVSLRLIPVWLMAESGERLKVNALLDDGSDTTYVRDGVVEALHLRGQPQTLKIATVGEELVTQSCKVKVTVVNLEETFQREVEAWTVQDLCSKVKVIDWRKLQENYEHLRNIPFPEMSDSSTVDILIGSNYPELGLSLDERHGKSGEPIARLTPLGWSCVGRYVDHTVCLNVVENSTNCYAGITVELDDHLRRMWNHEIDRPVNEQPYSADEARAYAKVEASLKKLDDRYQVAVPWDEEVPTLSDNRDSAFRRLCSLEKGMSKKPVEISERYDDTFMGNVEKGYVRKLSPAEAATPGWYLPHFAVIREDKETTKVRIVYDSAATYDGASLNDKMLTGPKLQRDITEILIRFRRAPVALNGDIKEMFNQVVLDPKDRRFHRLLYRNFNPSAPVDTYEAVRLVFGDKASPFLAQYVLQHHAKLMATEFPEAADVILNSVYMDDAIDSFEDTRTAVRVRQDLQMVLKGAGFHIRRWCSNQLDVLDGVPEEDRATGVNLEESELPSVKTLGVMWNALKDEFSFTPHVHDVCPTTKREILSRVATTFDPLQFLAPLVIKGKMLLQETWLLGIGWDDELPEGLQKSVEKWYQQLKQVDQITIPRCYRTRPLAEVATVSFHVFSDASKSAYAAVVYIRFGYKDGSIEVGFVIAKAKVSPLRAVSIPRLELMAAVLGVRLMKRVSDVLSYPESTCTYWTDSTDVLHWVHGQSRRYKPFVANRISEIHSYSLPSQWRHVPGSLNPADEASRGVGIHFLQPEQRWFQGPDFLREDEENWPQSGIMEVVSEEGKVEETVVKSVMNATTKTESSAVSVSSEMRQPLIDTERFSCWFKLLRVVSRVLRFVKLLRKKIQSKFRPYFISPAELWEAECVVLKQVQEECFQKTVVALRGGASLRQSSIRSLTPVLGPEGLLRVGGRLQFSSLPYEAQHPIILPKRHHVTTLLVREHHLDGLHVRGVNGVLADMRVKYWPICGREAVKRYERSCIGCKIRKKKMCQQFMAPLPSLRATIPIRAFAHCGVDYGGPFIVKLTRRCRAKRYLCLFTCLSSRAVHLEVAYGLDTASFLNALSRMIARRGHPEEMVSDNGSNFVGAVRELRELVQAIDADAVGEKLAKGGTTLKWNWNPPLGSHHGGVFEIMIKAAKRAIYSVLGDANPTDEELLTVVTEVEGLLNSRPLSYCSDDAKDEHVLTPNHFLYGQAGGQLAPRVVDEVAFNPRNRWRYVQDLVRRVWVRWQKEYLSLLQNRPKWQVETENLKEGDIVMMADPGNPRGRWPLGRVTEVFPGPDGLVRIVKVFTAGKEWRRPITSLSLLESRSDGGD